MFLPLSPCVRLRLLSCSALYRKIVSFVLLRSGLGSPTDIAVVREATGWFFLSFLSKTFSLLYFLPLFLVLTLTLFPSLSIAALQSVFPQTELGTFMALTRPEKEQQLRELSNIVTGIRLFNRDCGKGGEGIDNCE